MLNIKGKEWNLEHEIFKFWHCPLNLAWFSFNFSVKWDTVYILDISNSQSVNNGCSLFPNCFYMASFFPGEENDNPLQYYCLENPMDGGAWWATVHGVAKSWTWLSDFTLIYNWVILLYSRNKIQHCKCTLFQYNFLKERDGPALKWLAASLWP